MKGIIIEGSARSTGNTAKVAQYLQVLTGFELVHLCEKQILPFDYEFRNQEDDFSGLIEKIADEMEFIMFVTPVYWYSMSGRMKTFFDRISDCLYIRKETGRKLRGKKMIAISSNDTEQGDEVFFVPFKKSAGYLGMEYLGDLHIGLVNNTIPHTVKIRSEQFFKDLQILR